MASSNANILHILNMQAGGQAADKYQIVGEKGKDIKTETEREQAEANNLAQQQGTHEKSARSLRQASARGFNLDDSRLLQIVI